MVFKIWKTLLMTAFHYTPYFRLRNKILRLSGFEVGKNVYTSKCLEIADLASRKKTVTFGDRVSIGPNVTIITDSSPNFSRLIKLFPLVSKNVIIENDVWLGAGVIILPGVTIGECSVIGAGSIVTKDVPPYSVAIGIPAKVVSKIDENTL